MAISIVRVVNLAFGTGATPTPINADLSGADAVLVVGCGWTAAALTLNTLTVAGASAAITGLARAGDENAIYGAFLANCSTSATASIAPSWSTSHTDGPTFHAIVLACAAGQDIEVFDSDFDSATGSGLASVTSNSQLGYFGVGQAEEFGADPDLGAGQTISGTVLTNNSQRSCVYTITTGAATTTASCNTGGTDSYPSVSLFILREVAAPAAGGVVLAHNAVNFGANF